MRATIRSITTTHGEPLELFEPREYDVFDVSVRALLGPEGMPGEESFDFHVCTPRSLAYELELKGYLLVRRRLIVPAWEPELIRKTIAKLIRGVVRESWEELAQEINTMSTWEFENYRPASKQE